MNIGLLISGGLGVVILKKMVEHNYKLCFIMTDKNSTDIIELASKYNIDLFVGNPRNSSCDLFIKNRSIDILISVNYLFIIKSNLITLPKKIAFNIHGSLLPKYRGRTPHVWAIINNEKITGITAHLIEEGCDTGKIIEQLKVQINEKDTGADILNKYSELYFPMIESIIEKVKIDKVVAVPQNNKNATYFGKRTPDDGKISWSWQRERIKNWIRAQAYPYPGAFGFIEKNKVVIDEIENSDIGFNSEMSDGLIIEDFPHVIVKTPNGCVVLNKIRTGKEFCIKGKCFHG